MSLSLPMIWHMALTQITNWRNLLLMKLSRASLNIHVKAERLLDIQRDGCGGSTTSCKLCRVLTLLLSLIPSVSWPSDLCRSHVPDSSLSKQPIDRWIWLYPDSITPHAQPLPLRGLCACACLSVCVCQYRKGLGLHVQVCACKAWFGDFWQSCACMCVCVCQLQSFTPGPRSHGSEKTDWFLPSHAQTINYTALN